MTKPSLRIQEGALSAAKTPTQPPAPTSLVPMKLVASAGNSGQADGKS